MRFTILYYGYDLLPCNMLLAGERADHWVEIPIWGILMQSEGHNIIFDVGCMENAMTDGWNDMQKKRDPFYLVEGSMEGQLAKVGLTCEDIDTIVLSHLHSDHVGMLYKFPHCDVYCSWEEWIVAMKHAFGSSATREKPTPPYYYSTFSTPVKQYHWVKVDEEFTLFEGIDIITLPGHTPNLLALLLTTESGQKFIAPSDAVYGPDNVGPPIRLPGVLSDPENYRKSMEKVIRIAKEQNAQILYSHHVPFFETLKKAPEWYE